MNSANTALYLIDKTEENLKLIEQISGDFLAPVLNEWRYAVRHVISTFIKQDFSGIEAQKTIGHLKRAYFDSCDILLDCQLNLFAGTHSKCLGYSETVSKIVPEYRSYIKKARKAQSLHREAQNKHGDERESAYDTLLPVIRDLDEILDVMTFNADEITIAIRKEKNKEFVSKYSLIATIVGIAVTVASIVIAFVK